MLKENKIKLYLSIVFFLTISLALIIQHNVIIDEDNLYLLTATKAWLSGGTYTQDFIEPNPPLILLLYTPVVLLMQYAHMQTLPALYTYVSLLASLSIVLSYVLLQKIFNEPKLIFCSVLISAFVMFILPITAFGQRENLLVILTLPYVWAAVLTLQHKQLPTALSILVGVMAGLGFCIKPNFLLMFILIECYFIAKRMDLLGWVRNESLSVIFVGISYVVIVCLMFPDYVSVLLPMLFRYFHGQHWYRMLVDAIPMYVLMTILFGIVILKKSKYPAVLELLLVSTCGLLLSYLISGVNEYYHVLPVLSFAILLGFFCLWLNANNKWALSLLTMFILFCYPAKLITTQLFDAIHEKQYGNFPALTAFFQQYPDSTYTYFSRNDYLILLDGYTHSHFVGNVALLWWARPMSTWLAMPIQSDIRQQLLKDQQFFVNALSQNLDSKKPGFIVVSAEKDVQALSDINDFIIYPEFQTAWQHYKYIAAVSDFRIYRRLG